ncbi:hypothetical protein V6N13_080314 [Hibiscus sabdariffa]
MKVNKKFYHFHQDVKIESFWQLKHEKGYKIKAAAIGGCCCNMPGTCDQTQRNTKAKQSANKPAIHLETNVVSFSSEAHCGFFATGSKKKTLP